MGIEVQVLRRPFTAAARGLTVLARSSVAAGLLLALLASRAAASEWYVAPGGTTGGNGTRVAPWDLQSALGGKHGIAPGDTLWIRGGTYKRPFEVLGQGFEVRLAGRADAPIRVRAVPSERATIDGGLTILPPATYLWIQDLEICVSEPRPAQPVPPDPSYRVVNRPWGGLNINTGEGCKYINLVIHDNCQGVSFWSAATDSELYGCLIYDNGWAGTDRGHGHAIYTQNKTGVKTIADCIMTGGYGYTLHAYGSPRADVDNYRVEGNICYDAHTFLIGGGKPSHHIRVYRNSLYRVNMQLGYDAPYNEDCEVLDNTILRGALSINRYRSVRNQGNRIVAPGENLPKGARIILRPNQYDPARANLAIYNFDRKPVVEVDGGAFLHRGDQFRLMDPRDFYGKPILAGVYRGRPVRVPVAGEFAAFVLMKQTYRQESRALREQATGPSGAGP
jgi:hypothetical protein